MDNLDHLRGDYEPCDLSRLDAMIQSAEELKAHIEAKETELADLKKSYNALTQEDIPQFLLSFGLSEVRLDNGKKVIVKQDVSVSVADQESFMAFLRARGDDDLAKLQVSFPKMDRATTEKIFDFLSRNAYDFDAKQAVHHSTLKAYIRNLLCIGAPPEQYSMKIAQGAAVPREELEKFLKIYTYWNTNIK